jgi:hypothetical protein
MLAIRAGAMNKPENFWEKWKAISLEAKLAMFVAPVVVFVVTAFIARVVNDRETASANLQVVRLLPINGPGKKYHQAIIDLTLRNTGGTVSVLTHAQFHLRRVEAITQCSPPAELLPSGRYSIVLDQDRPTVTSQLNQAVGPNQADRFTFSVGLPPRSTNGVEFIYQLDVTLYHDADPRPINAGSVLLALPFNSPRLFNMLCGDADKLASFLASDSARSPELDAFGRVVGAR